MPLIESWGVWVNHENSPTVAIPDPRLHWHIAQQSAINQDRADVRFFSRKRMEGLYRLNAFNSGLADLAGLEWAANLQSANLGSNSISDVSPLSKLDYLADLDLRDNRVSDVSALVGMNALQRVDLSGNPLTEEALNDQILRLRSNSVKVEVESVEWEIPAGAETATFEVGRYFRSLLGSVFGYEAAGDDPGLAAVRMNGSVLEVSPQGGSGVLTATVTASTFFGTRATLRFRIPMTYAADDHGNERASATDLAVGAQIEAQIDHRGDRDWFRVTLTEPASVAVYATGDLNTAGSLHDDSGARVASDDNGGANFHVESTRPAGVYYVRVEASDGTAGSYTLHVRRFADVALGDTGETVRLWATADDAWTLDRSTNAPFASGGEVTAHNGGRFVLSLGAGGAWSAAAVSPCEAGTWFIDTIFGTAGDGGEPTCALSLELGVPVPGQIEAGDETHWFRLQLDAPASVAVYTTGSLDTVGRLHDESGEQIAWNDDDGARFNFHIEGDRPAGVYYVQVDSYGSRTGSYTLHALRSVDVALGETDETERLWGTAGGGGPPTALHPLRGAETMP